MSTAEQARDLLTHVSWFREASDDLLAELSARMVPLQVEEGHQFMEEGDEVTNIIFLDAPGKLVRTKLSIDDATQIEDAKNSVKSFSQSLRGGDIMTLQDLKDVEGAADVPAIVVDVKRNRGDVVGMLHSLMAPSGEGVDAAFATVTAAPSSHRYSTEEEREAARQPGAIVCKAWILSTDDFRHVVSTNPDYALQMMHALARELRSGSKSLRGLLKHVTSRRGSMNELAEADKQTQVCRVLCYDATSWTHDGFVEGLQGFNALPENAGFRIDMDFTTERLSEKSAAYAAGYDAVCLFVNDNANADVLQTLSLVGVRMIAMRCAGFDRVNTKVARAYGLTVARVPAYSPYAVAEMGISLLMAVNRRITKASNRVKMANFTLDAGLMGMDIYGKTVGVMGTGKIGQILCDILLGFGAKLICYDVFESDSVKAKGGVYVTQDELYAQSDVIFLMMPLFPSTKHTINEGMLSKLKPGVILINTSRGGLVDTKALLKGLQNGIIRGVGMDVYENEGDYFFQDWSAKNIQDEDLVALLGHKDVVLTAHQAFFTKEAVDKIIMTSMENIRDFGFKNLTGQSHPNNCIPPQK